MSVALFPKFSNIPNRPKFSIDCAPSPPPSCPTGDTPAIPPPPSHARAPDARSREKFRFPNFGSLTFGTPIFPIFALFY